MDNDANDIDSIMISIDEFLNFELYESARDWCSLLINSKDKLSGTYDDIPILIYIRIRYGDAIFGLEEYNFSKEIFEEIYIELSELFINDIKRSVRTIRDDISQRIAKCCLKIGDNENINKAISYLETIPESYRNLGENAILSRLYKRTNQISSSLRSSKLCLKQNPFALEIAKSFLDLNPSPSEFTAIIKTQRNAFFSKLSSYFSAYGLICQNKEEESLHYIDELELQYKNCPAIIALKANALFNLQQYSLINILLSQYHLYCPLSTQPLIYYACALVNLKGKEQLLSEMSTELMNNNKNDYTGYIFGALYWNIQGEKERALYLINKSIELNPKLWLLHYIKAEMTDYDLNLSIKHYWISFGLKQRIYTLQRIVHVYQKLNQNMNALVVAKECMIAYPHHPLSQTLMGNVLETQRTGGYNKAKQIYEDVLKKHPNYRHALMSLANLEYENAKYENAANLFKKILYNENNENIRLKYCICLSKIYKEKPSSKIMVVQMLHCILMYVLDKIIRENPDNVEAQELLSQLKEEE